MYSDIMEFKEVPEAAHHVPLDKPIEIIDIMTIMARLSRETFRESDFICIENGSSKRLCSAK